MSNGGLCLGFFFCPLKHSMASVSNYPYLSCNYSKQPWFHKVWLDQHSLPEEPLPKKPICRCRDCPTQIFELCPAPLWDPLEYPAFQRPQGENQVIMIMWRITTTTSLQHYSDTWEGDVLLLTSRQCRSKKRAPATANCTSSSKTCSTEYCTNVKEEHFLLHSIIWYNSRQGRRFYLMFHYKINIQLCSKCTVKSPQIYTTPFPFSITRCIGHIWVGYTRETEAIAQFSCNMACQGDEACDCAST